MAVKELTSSTFKDGIATGYTLVDFWAEWCTPCKMIAPVVEKLSETMGNKLNFAKLDTDSNSDIPQSYNILGIPTLLLFKDGELVGRHTGAAPEEVLVSFIEENVK